MDRLEENNIESYVTGLDGAVMVKMDKNGNYKIKLTETEIDYGT